MINKGKNTIFTPQKNGLVLFVSLDGVQLILDTLRETFDTAIRSGASELDPKSLIIAGVVLLYFGYRKISSMA